MVNKNQATKTISLESYGIYNANVNYQLTAAQLQKDTILKGQGKLAKSGALAVNTGEFTGRSPMDRFIVKDNITKDKIISIIKNPSPENEFVIIFPYFEISIDLFFALSIAFLMISDNLFSSNIFIAASVVPPFEVTFERNFFISSFKNNIFEVLFKRFNANKDFSSEVILSKSPLFIIDSMKYIM